MQKKYIVQFSVAQMGNCAKGASRQPTINQPSLPKVPSKLLSSFTCPNCYFIFQKGQQLAKFNNHMKMCVIQADSLPKISQQSTVTALKNPRKCSTSYVYQKTPMDQQGVKFNWKRVESMSLLQQRNKIKATPDSVKNWPFQLKTQWFRSKLEDLRINWEKGCSWLKVNKAEILLSSLQNAKKVNMHKEIKIQFVGEDTHDAGGLMRQWIHLLTKEIFSQDLNIFSRAETDEVFYKLNSDSEVDAEFAQQILELFGTVLGKALFQKIPVCSYLDRTIIRQLCGGNVSLADVHSYDQGLYQSWKYINNASNIEDDMDITFSVTETSSKKIIQIPLKTNGNQISLTDENKGQYIDLCIDYYCCKRVQKLVKILQKSLYKVIPVQYLSVFEPFQLEMLLYGVPFIDVKDWRQNTVYTGGYYATHKTILWFWEFMGKLTQEELSKFLQFCTGSERTPINGFKSLETNRGNQSRFTIQSRVFNVNDPFPKSHTCFNRLELPAYPKKQLAFKYLQQLMNFETEGLYGLQ